VVRLLRGLTIGAVVRGNNPHGQPELQRVRGRVVVATDHPRRSLRFRCRLLPPARSASVTCRGHRLRDLRLLGVTCSTVGPCHPTRRCARVVGVRRRPAGPRPCLHRRVSGMLARLHRPCTHPEWRAGRLRLPPSRCRRAAGWWSWADSSSGAGPLRTAAPARPWRSWPRIWGQACGGRRRPRPGPRRARTASQLDQRCDGAGRG
jgi:hypothetical protein